MFNRSLKVATVWGIPIRLHVSLLVTLIYFCYRFDLYAGLMIQLGLCISVLLHELGHCWVALVKHCRVREITLMFIGGAAQMESIPRRPRDEILMAIAGPAVSLALAGIFFGLAYVLELPNMKGLPFGFFEFLFAINIVLGTFNLIPSFPMDGGRVLRAALTKKLGRLHATAIASRLGKLIAFGFGLYGFTDKRYFLVAIAFFVYIAAENEYRMVQMQEMATGRYRPFDFRRGFSKPPPVQEDEIVVSPPPYADGPHSNAEVSSSDSRSQT